MSFARPLINAEAGLVDKYGVTLRLLTCGTARASSRSAKPAIIWYWSDWLYWCIYNASKENISSLFRTLVSENGSKYHFSECWLGKRSHSEIWVRQLDLGVSRSQPSVSSHFLIRSHRDAYWKFAKHVIFTWATRWTGGASFDCPTSTTSKKASSADFFRVNPST
jgi:hypothetical protein